MTMTTAMTEITFYSAWYCPFAQRSWAALEHLEVPYMYQEIDPYEKSAAWLEVSRGIGQVPVLKYRQGENQETRIPDSFRIIDFLDDLNHETSTLYPKNIAQKAEARFWSDQLGRTVVPYFYLFLKAERGSASAEDSKNQMIAGIEAFVQAMSDNGPFSTLPLRHLHCASSYCFLTTKALAYLTLEKLRAVITLGVKR